MATALKRSVTSSGPSLTVHNGARTTHWELPSPKQSVREIQRIHDPGQFKDVPDASNPLIPPYHWHWYQNESFHITQGRFIFTLEGNDTVKFPADGVVQIPAGARHTFRVDPTCVEECVIEISAEPEEQSGISERFFRNLYSYLDDCEKQKVAPSLPQLLLFLDSAEVSLAFPGPLLLVHWASYALGVVVGRWFGGYVLGYKASYEEYYDSNLAKKK